MKVSPTVATCICFFAIAHCAANAAGFVRNGRLVTSPVLVVAAIALAALCVRATSRRPFVRSPLILTAMGFLLFAVLDGVQKGGLGLGFIAMRILESEGLPAFSAHTALMERISLALAALTTAFAVCGYILLLRRLRVLGLAYRNLLMMCIAYGLVSTLILVLLTVGWSAYHWKYPVTEYTYEFHRSAGIWSSVILAIVGAVLSVMVLKRRRALSTQLSSLPACMACGYPRAIGSVCPECGCSATDAP